MAKRLGTIWKLPPHTRAKHAILRGYLDAWLPIMASWNQGLLFIDGFAGPGRYEDGEDGSPIIALKAALEHRSRPTARLVYLFIEEDRDRKQSLDQEIAAMELPENFAVHTHLGFFDETLNGLLDEVAHEGTRLLPTFAFVDPCGWSQTPLETIERLLTRHRAEVLINFMYEEINRFILVPEHAASFDRLFGTDEWRGIASVSGVSERRRFIHDLYDRQLRSRAQARFVRSFEMRNDKDATDYFLFFATNDQTGLAKMKEAMWRVDPGGSFAFSDATDPNQLVLFGREPDYWLLRQQIARRFGGRTVSVSEIERFVVEETAFLSTHYKKGALRVMEQAQPPELEIIWAKEGRRRGTFPPTTMLKIHPSR